MRSKKSDARRFLGNEAEAARIARAVATLGRHTDSYKSVKIIYYPPHQFPQAREIAAFFRGAGWQTNFNETAQEPHAKRYFEGVEVSGFNSPLVQSVGEALSEAGIPTVRTVIKSLEIPLDNPKYPYSFDSIRVTIGHTPPQLVVVSSGSSRRYLSAAVVLIGVTISAIANFATEWKTNPWIWLALLALTLTWAVVEWVRDSDPS